MLEIRKSNFSLQKCSKCIYCLWFRSWSRDFNKKLSLIDCLFGDFKLTKNADPDKYGYLSCGIEVDASLQFLLPVG